MTPPTDFSRLSIEEIASQLEQLESAERTASRRRSSLHDRIEFVHAGAGVDAEIARDQLGVLKESERDLSIRRRALHQQIDELRAERSRRLAATGSD